jgi:hypothetical protein
VTFSTIKKGKLLDGYYSFVEDFRRDKVSTTKTRKASFGNGWVRLKDDQWTPLDQAKFTADNNPVTNIDAGLIEDRFFLATGGDLKNQHTKLGEKITLPQAPQSPPDIPQSLR